MDLEQNIVNPPLEVRKPAKSTPLWKKIVGGTFYVVFLLFALLIGSAAGWLNKSDAMKAALPVLLSAFSPKDVFKTNELTILMLGCDEILTPGGGSVTRNKARSDMMLLAKLDFDHKTITGVSIPRDIRVKMPGFAVHKINAFHAIAKAGEEEELTQKAVEYTLPGVHIDRVLTIDYEAFVNMIDLVDGVEVDVDKVMKYTDVAGGLFIDLKPGHQVLDGYDAMCFVRFRKDAGSDLKRQERQKQLLVAVKDRIIQNWTKLPQVLDLGAKAMDMNGSEMAALAKFSRSVSKENIQLGQLATKNGRGSFLLLDQRKLSSTLRKYRLLPPLTNASLDDSISDTEDEPTKPVKKPVKKHKPLASKKPAHNPTEDNLPTTDPTEINPNQSNNEPN